MKEEISAEELLFFIRKVNMKLSAQLALRLKLPELTGMQIYFLVYILRHHPKGTYLTELCREIGVSKATLSSLLRKLEEKEYLYVCVEQEDIRRKKVLPTAKLISQGSGFLQKAEKLESEICSVLSRAEREQLIGLEKKLLKQFAAMEDNEKHKTGGYIR